VKEAIKKKTTTKLGPFRFSFQNSMLFIELPSGRRLSYVKPRIGTNQYGGESVTYEGIGFVKKWERLESYGPKFVENIVQAISRDILCNAMKALRDEYIVAHVHDELIIECPLQTPFEDICRKMGRTPEWLPGLVLRADGYDAPKYYQKD